MSLRLNRLHKKFRKIRELPGIGRRRRTRNEIRSGRNLAIDFMILRQKRDQTFISRILSAVIFIY